MAFQKYETKSRLYPEREIQTIQSSEGEDCLNTDKTRKGL